MSLKDRLLLLWHRWETRRKMNRVFSRREDPFQYRTTSYERARLGAMADAVSGRSYAWVLEAGCAEGDFTETLAGLADRVIALDISPVALARARARLAGRGVEFVETDIRAWASSAPGFFDLIVLADVLYYLDKPLVRPQFERVFPAVVSWLKSGGTLLLAHGFAGEAQFAHRRGFRERFEKLGLKLRKEETVGQGLSAGPVCCFLSVLQKE